MTAVNTRRREKPAYKPEKYNTAWQYYRGIPIRLIVYSEQHFAALRAKRFLLGKSEKQNIWIPNSCLKPDGTLDTSKQLDWIFKKAAYQNKLKLAGINIDPLRWRS